MKMKSICFGVLMLGCTVFGMQNVRATEITLSFSATAEWGSVESALSKAMWTARTFATREGYRDCVLTRYVYWRPSGTFWQVTAIMMCRKKLR